MPKKKATKKQLARVLSLSEKVTLRDQTVITVQEVSLEQFLGMVCELEELPELFASLSTDESFDYRQLISNPSLFSLLKKLAAACSDKPASFFESRPISDWLKIIKAVKEVHDMEEIMSLFLELVQGMNSLMETSSDDKATSENQY